jgi:hypothetical protein
MTDQEIEELFPVTEEIKAAAAADPWGPEAFIFGLGIWAKDWQPEDATA